ncbi:MAG TPA: MBOAT family O-acyltransferase [Prolixibacteraceae bacterium]|nr:MBOAT family O-acyltransferase [Prolixibacteraceae bacterium]HPS13660.1 MBOAT family O-acyltransferase [Prolixibacteraceae bacterium]
MLFNSLIFVAFAILFFSVAKLIGNRVKVRLTWLTAMSLLFYGWWDWRFLFLIIFSGGVDFLAAMGMTRWEKRRKLFLVLSLIANLGALSIFKYSGFIAHNIDAFLKLPDQLSLYKHIPEFFLITPVGISFYTFHSMSYTIDVYKRKCEPTKNVIHFFAFISMFTQLVAGPILRAKDMLPQLLKINPISKEERWNGFRYIVRGYFKKMVIADNLAPIVVAAFSSPDIKQSSLYWWGIMIAFALQIYCDFAGYSDIARGLAKWLGYDFNDNFNHPYISTSLKEFWTRWHISLSSWFRDYLYIPLGGNRKGKLRSDMNMWITMLLSGLWHGAAWTFICWGAIHAFFLNLERITKWPERFKKSKILVIAGWGFVTIQVLVAWVFFRSENIGQAWNIVKTMFSFTGSFELGWGLNGTVFIVVMMVREIVEAIGVKEKIDWTSGKWMWIEIILYALLITTIVFFRGNGSEFIYFQF